MLQEYLRGLNPHEFLDRVSKFRDLDFKRISSEEIYKKFLEVLMFGEPGKAKAVHVSTTREFQIGTRFYRIRKLKSEDNCIPVRDMRTEADAWEPPSHVVRAGRLNRAGESLLYTAPDIHVALEEMKITDGELVPVIVYETVKPITMVDVVGSWLENENELSSEEKLKLRLVTDFLHYEFVREVGQGTEHLYKISELLAKKHNPLPPHISDGWCYPSVAKKGGMNTCFRPDAAKIKLVLKGFMLTHIRVVDDQYLSRIVSVAHGFDADGRFKHHPVFDEATRRMFPEMNLHSARVLPPT